MLRTISQCSRSLIVTLPINFIKKKYWFLMRIHTHLPELLVSHSRPHDVHAKLLLWLLNKRTVCFPGNNLPQLRADNNNNNNKDL